MRKTLLSILATAVLLGVANFALAQGELKPVAIASFAGYDALKADIGVIGRLSGKPDLANNLDMMLKMMTQGKGLAGLDAKRPWGVVVMTDGQMAFPAYGYLPVTDLKQLIEVAKANPMLAQAIKLNGDVYEIQVGRQPIHIQQKGEWAVVTTNNDTAANAPADPLVLMGDLPKNYDLAVRYSLKNVPEMMRQMMLSQLQSQADRGLPQMPGETASSYNARMFGFKHTLQAFTAIINDLDTVTIGLKIDPNTSRAYLDLEATTGSGTKLADRFAGMKPGKTAFAGVQIPEAAVTVNRIGTLTADDISEAQATLDMFHKRFLSELGQQGLGDDQVALVTRLSGDVLDVLKKTLGTKKIDGGFALLLEPAAATVVGGAAVVDGAKLEKVVKDLVGELLKSDPESAKAIKLNADAHEGVHFHHLSIPTPDPKLVPMVGDTLEVIFGTAADKVMMAAGRDAAKTLKKVLDGSKAAADQEVASFEMKLAIGKIAKFALEAAKNDAAPGHSIGAGMLTAALEKAGDKDHVIVTASPVPQGMRMRVELEEGLLKAIISAAPMAMPMGGMPPPGGPGPGIGGPPVQPGATPPPPAKKTPFT